MDATVTKRVVDIRRLWKRYRGAIFVLLSCLIIFLFYYTITRTQQRGINNFLQDYQGGTDYGLLLAYLGLSLTVVAQAYTVVKRIGVPEYIRKLGGAGLWLNIHIVVSLAGFFAILVHAGFPFQFRTSNLWSHGFAAFATWLLLITTISGVFGRYLYRHLPAFKRAFDVWKPTHLVVTALFFIFALVHVWIETAGGG